MNKYTIQEKVLLVICFVIIIFCVLFYFEEMAIAEDALANAWILRRAETDNVLVQKEPGRQPYEYFRFIDNDPPCGAELQLTGEQKGAWLECRCLYLPGQPVGWVHQGFVVHDQPKACGMVATVTRPVKATESIGGREAWECVAGERVKVLYRAEEWCTTIWGFVPSDALDFSVTGAVTQPRRVWPDWNKRDHLINVIDWGL